MQVIDWVSLSLGYLAIGHIYSLLYVLVYRPDGTDAQVGLMVLAWPIFIVSEVVLGIASQFGKVVALLSDRIRP